MGLECFNEEAQPWMVHSSQTLRLFFRQPLPSRILLNEPILCSTFVANEFGLFSKTAFQDHQVSNELLNPPPQKKSKSCFSLVS